MAVECPTGSNVMQCRSRHLGLPVGHSLIAGVISAGSSSSKNGNVSMAMFNAPGMRSPDSDVTHVGVPEKVNDRLNPRGGKAVFTSDLQPLIEVAAHNLRQKSPSSPRQPPHRMQLFIKSSSPFTRLCAYNSHRLIWRGQCASFWLKTILP